MSLQGTGSSSEYWSGAFSTGRPVTVSFWVYQTSDGSDEGIIQIGGAGYGIGLNIRDYDSAGDLIDFNDAGSDNEFTSSYAMTAGIWNFLTFIINPIGGSNSIILNAGTATTGATCPAGTATYSYLCLLRGLPGAAFTGTNTTTFVAEVSIWNGVLSSTDISNLYNGGAGGNGVNPLSLGPTGGATLTRYYLPNAHNTSGTGSFADFSGTGGVTLAASGGATPSWSSNNPPVASPGGVSVHNLGLLGVGNMIADPGYLLALEVARRIANNKRQTRRQFINGWRAPR